jgi:hypothetical protein
MKPSIFFAMLVFFLVGCGNKPTGAAKLETSMNPQDILFTTPTLNDALPANLGSAVVGDNCYQMHEDDWRQFEFVSAAFDSQLADEIAAIDKIWQEQSVPLGDHSAFRAVHVRKAIPNPLDIPFSVAEFEGMFGGKVAPITIAGYDKVLRDVHAIRLQNLIVYGTISDGKIATLGLEPLDRFTLPDNAAARLEQFVTKHDLRLVHWRSRTLFKTPKDIIKYLRGNRS